MGLGIGAGMGIMIPGTGLQVLLGHQEFMELGSERE